jgi:hypothetical protein
MILDSLRQRVLDGIETFLEQRGIDLTQFTQAQNNITTNNYSIQHALAQSMNIGTGGTITYNGSGNQGIIPPAGAAPPPGGAPGGHPTPQPKPPPWAANP